MTGSSMSSRLKTTAVVTGDDDASYHIGGISLEYDMVTLPELARIIDNQYKALADVNLGEFLTSTYSLWLDLRTSDDDRLHGSGRRIENASEGITIQITKKAEAAGALNIYLFVVMDAQLKFEDGRFVSAAYKPLAADDPIGDDMRTVGMWKNSFHLRSARRPLPGVLSIHRGPVPDRTV